MTDEQGLLAAIWADPHDDTPRLVYADWLDENDQPARAEFVRVQCALARLDEYDEVERPPLAKREQLLWKRHAKDWKAGLPKALQTAAFRRGFPAPRLKATIASSFLKLPPDEFAAAPLWWYSIPPAPSRLGKLLACPQLLRVGALQLGEGWLSPPADVTAFAASPNVRNLSSLDLSRTYRFGERGVAALAAGAANLPHLRTLNLSVCNLNGKALAALAASPLHRQLTALDLSGNDAKGGSMEAIFAPGAFPALTTLSTPSTIGVDGLKAVAASSPAFALRRLRIYVEERANVSAFAAWPGLKSVRELDLFNSLIRDRVAALFASPHLADLRSLRIEMMGNRPADLQAFRDLAAGKYLPGLRELRLVWGRYVIDAAAGVLADRFGDGLTIT
jgi:uncharacterized protein (TIGR02996 family)